MKKQFLSAALSAALILSSAAAALQAGAAEAARDDAAEAPQAASGESSYGLPERTADGVTLHCFDWSYNAIKENLADIAAAGYTTVQTSPVQTPKDFGEWLNGEGQWWKLYQPLSFSIATENSWLGTKDELQSLCEEADKYGIKIICDIVSNHMANQDGNTYLTVCRDIKKYEPDIYAQKNETFHQLKKGTDDDNKLEWIVQGELNKLPDLNTSNPLVQERVISLLKECIDVGVDGFRFDAAKHIETPADGDYASDFWPNVTGAANDYAASKGTEIYMYGEILNTPGKGRLTTDYTKYLDVIDNKMGDGTLAYVKNKNAKMVATALNYHYDYEDPSNVVVWAESHDTYMDGKSRSATDKQIAQTWALVAGRAKSHALFFARPNELMGLAGNPSWKSNVVQAVNKFHNKFIGVDDAVFYEGDVVAVRRGDSGIVIVNLGEGSDITLNDSGMKDGTYTDAVTGNTFTVSGGKLTGTIGEEGVAVIYQGAQTTPMVHFTEDSATFRMDTYTVYLTIENAESGTYSVNGGTPVTFTGMTSFKIGEGIAEGSDITVTATATMGNTTTEETHTYTKEKSTHSGNFVYFDNSKANYDHVYCYGYWEEIDENGRKDPKAKDGQWPGHMMEYDEEKGLYVYELPTDIPVGKGSVIINNGINKETPGMIVPSSESIYSEKDNALKTYNPNGVTLIYGDLNSDGVVASDDALSVLRISTLMDTPTEEQEAQADVDGDGMVTSGDAVAVLRYGTGFEDAGSKVGTEFTFGSDSPANPEPKDSDTDTDKKPDDNPDPEPSGNIFYAINSAGWIFHDGCKLWLVNADTKQAVEMTKCEDSDDAKYAYVDLPKGWTKIELHRTQWNMTIEESEGDPAHMVWTPGEIPEGKNAWSIQDNGATAGKFKNYTPAA